MLPQAAVVAKLSWLNAVDDLLALVDQRVELLAGTDVERSEPVEELAKIADGRIPENLRPTVLLTAEPFAQVRNEP